jgi:CIC family chloride channel protein
MSGMLLLGVLMYVLLRQTGAYQIEGVGYATIQQVLSGTLHSFWFVLLLFALKLFATSLTLGSGASGRCFFAGTFSRGDSWQRRRHNRCGYHRDRDDF